MTEEPLIWTSKGNLPISCLQHDMRWEETDMYIKFVERYTLDGEVVKESAHVKCKHGFTMGVYTGEV